MSRTRLLVADAPGGPHPSLYLPSLLREFTVERFVAHIADPRQAVLTCERGPYLLGYLRLDFDAACPTVPCWRCSVTFRTSRPARLRSTPPARSTGSPSARPCSKAPP